MAGIVKALVPLASRGLAPVTSRGLVTLSKPASRAVMRVPISGISTATINSRSWMSAFGKRMSMWARRLASALRRNKRTIAIASGAVAALGLARLFAGSDESGQEEEQLGTSHDMYFNGSWTAAPHISGDDLRRSFDSLVNELMIKHRSSMADSRRDAEATSRWVGDTSDAIDRIANLMGVRSSSILLALLIDNASGGAAYVDVYSMIQQIDADEQTRQITAKTFGSLVNLCNLIETKR